MLTSSKDWIIPRTMKLVADKKLLK
jgi:hypothetical protein